jgi:CRISPR-associated exonuclease Cas4
MPWADDELVPISALEHYSYCPRQCGLIHVEQVWSENLATTRGEIVHARVDELAHESRPGIRREFALPLWCERLGLTGRADLIEFGPEGAFPVEYKVGRRRSWGHEAIQLCAQAICLEEMLGQPVTSGAIYYHGSHARREVEFDAALRRIVEETTVAVRAMIDSRQLPPPIADARCRRCSLRDQCLPETLSQPVHIRYWKSARFDAVRPASDEERL